MKNHCVLFPLFLLICMMLTGCSKDEKEFSIDFNFQLRTVEGDSSHGFGYGDNIVFDLEIINNSDFDVTYGPNDADVVLDDELFRVYSKDGREIGLPWTGMYCEFSEQQYWTIPAKSVKHVICPWFQCESASPSHPLCKAVDNPLLSVGDYYTRFSVSYFLI